MTKTRLIKHNPAFLSKEELSSLFVVRKREMELLLEIVRNNSGPVNQHVIIIAPRGMGKTMLVRRLALEIQSDEELRQQWYSVVPPEELYDVASEGELWLSVLQCIGEQEKENDRGRLLQKYTALSTEQNERLLKIQALSAILDFAQGKRLLIVIENLQMLLGEQSSDDDAWDMRQTLLNHPELMLVTTATTHFGEIRNAAKANFELFREIFLPPLDTAACRTLWQRITGEELLEDRIRPMEILTGGSPRLLAILADFGAGRPLQELMDNLVGLIDDHTTYFKANVEALPNKERRVFVTLAELWEPSMAKDVAERCRLNVNITSALLKRLVEKGAVSQVAQKGRSHYYQITERLYNIYHLMRLSGSAGARVQALIRCMVPIYGEVAIACALANETCGVDNGMRSFLIQGYGSILEHAQQKMDLFRSIVENTPQAFFELPEAFHLKSLVENRASYAGASNKKSLTDTEKLLSLIAQELEQGNFTALLEKSNQTIESFANSKDPNHQEQATIALFAKGFALTSLDRSEEALEVFNITFARLTDLQHPSNWDPLIAMALIDKGSALVRLGRNEEALAAYESIIARFTDSQVHERTEIVAKAFINKGFVLQELGRSEEALAACESIIARFAELELPDNIEKLIGEAFIQKSSALLNLDKKEEALVACEAAITRFTDSQAPHAVARFASALLGKCSILAQLGRMEETLVTIDIAISRLTDSQVPTLMKVAPSLSVIKGDLLKELGRNDEALVAYDSTISRFADLQTPGAIEEIGRAYAQKAWLLCLQKDSVKLNEAIKAAEMATQILPKDNTNRYTIARLYGRAGRWNEALEQAAFFVNDPHLTETCLDDILNFFMNAAAAGKAEDALKTLNGTVTAMSLDPLVAALKMLTGSELHAPREVMEVASDIVKKIRSGRVTI